MLATTLLCLETSHDDETLMHWDTTKNAEFSCLVLDDADRWVTFFRCAHFKCTNSKDKLL